MDIWPIEFGHIGVLVLSIWILSELNNIIVSFILIYILLLLVSLCWLLRILVLTKSLTSIPAILFRHILLLFTVFSWVNYLVDGVIVSLHKSSYCLRIIYYEVINQKQLSINLWLWILASCCSLSSRDLRGWLSILILLLSLSISLTVWRWIRISICRWALSYLIGIYNSGWLLVARYRTWVLTIFTLFQKIISLFLILVNVRFLNCVTIILVCNFLDLILNILFLLLHSFYNLWVCYLILFNTCFIITLWFCIIIYCVFLVEKFRYSWILSWCIKIRLLLWKFFRLIKIGWFLGFVNSFLVMELWELSKVREAFDSSNLSKTESSVS